MKNNTHEVSKDGDSAKKVWKNCVLAQENFKMMKELQKMGVGLACIEKIAERMEREKIKNPPQKRAINFDFLDGIFDILDSSL